MKITLLCLKLFFITICPWNVSTRNIFENNPFLQNALGTQKQKDTLNKLPGAVVYPYYVTPEREIVQQISYLSRNHDAPIQIPIPREIEAKVQGNDALRRYCLKPRGQFPSSKCNKFVNCWDDSVLEQFCPEGLLFNSTSLYCDYPQNVDCKGKPLELIPGSTYPVTQEPSGLPATNPNPLIKKCLQVRGLFESNICNKFINCWDGYAIEQDCPPGLYFSGKGYCDYPYNVDCKNRVVVQYDPEILEQTVSGILLDTHLSSTEASIFVETSSSTVNVHQRCPKENGLHPTEICNNYINCWEGNAIEQSCPPELLFNELGYCDHPYNVDCKGRKIVNITTAIQNNTETSTQNSLHSTFLDESNESNLTPVITISSSTEQITVSNPNFEPSSSSLLSKCIQPNGLFPSDTCNYYVNCWEGNAVEQACPPGLLFSEKGYCDHFQNVDCRNRKIVELITTHNPNDTASLESHLILDPIASDEHLHGSTTSSTPLVPISDSALVQNPFFNPSLTINKIFQTSDIPSTIPEISSPVPDYSKNCPGTNGLFPSDSCHTYINCWDNNAVEQPCPPNLLFSLKGYCDFPVNVDCTNRSIDNINITNFPVQDEISPTSLPTLPVNSIGFSVDEDTRMKCKGVKGSFATESCENYIECWEDVVIERECPPGLLFSEENGYCDFGYRVDCKNRTRKENVPDLECPQADGVFRNASNCSQYFVCNAGHVVSKHECPTGLNYNDVISVCDYASRVNCTNKPYIYPVNLNLLKKVPASLFSKSLGCVPERLFKLNEECNKVVICRNDLTEVITCPNGLAYDSPSDKCLLPQASRCYDFQ